MKHRLLNFLLLAAMLCVGISAHADTSTVGNTDNSSGFASAFSDIYTLKANESLHLEFTNNNDGSANTWHNWLLFLDSNKATGNNTSQYFCLRADKWAWNSSYDSKNTSWYTSLTTSDGYFDSFMTDMNGAKVVLDIVRSGKTVTTTAKATSTGSKELTETFVINCGDGTQEVYAFLSVENAHIVIDNAATKISGPDAPVTVADIDFSNAISDGAVAGTVGSMTIGTGGAADYIQDGCLRIGDHANTIAIPAEKRPGSKGSAELSFKMTWGNKNSMGSGFRLKDAEGNEIASFQYARWDGNGKNANTLGIDMTGLVGSHYSNKPIIDRYTEFKIKVDYKKGIITSDVSCVNPVASNSFEVKLTNKNPLATVEFFGYNVGGNTDRTSSLDDVKIVTVQQAPTEVYFSESYTSTSTTEGWASATGGRFTPTILSEGDNYFMSVDQGQRNNNGTTVTSTVLQDKIAAGKDFTLAFDMKLGNSNNQEPVSLTIGDAANTGIAFSLTATGKNVTTWKINGTDTQVTLPNSGVNAIDAITWCSYRVIHKGKKDYLTIINKETGDYILQKAEVTGVSTTGGLGKITFVTRRYNANFAMDNIEVREITDEDLEPAVTFSESYTSTSATTGWTSATGGRFTPVILNDGDNYYLSVDQGQRNNNGTTVTGTILKGLAAADEDFTLEFDMKLASSNNQDPVSLTIGDAADTGIMFSLTATGKNVDTWKINGTDDLVTLPGSKTNNLDAITWISYKVTRSGKTTYLTITNKETGDVILGRTKVNASVSAAGGLGTVTFVTRRYNANFAIDNIVVRGVAPRDVPDALPATYTVKFLEDNTTAPELKTAVLHEEELFVDDEAVANDEEMHLFDVGSTRYIYTKSDTIALSDDPAANILNVYFHKALNYDWEVVGKYDMPTNVFSIENGTALEGDTLEVTYRQFYVKDGIQYKTTAAADGRYVYRFPIVKQETPATVQVDTLFYTKVGPVEIVEELEDAPGLVVVANEKCSGGNYAYTPTDDFVQVTTKPLDPGTYTLTIGTFDEKKGDGKTLSGNYFVFNAVPRGSVLPTTEADRFTTAAYGVGALQHDITIYTPSYLYMKGGEAGVGIDYITVARSGDLNEASGYVNVPDSLAEDVLTEMATISADEFDVNISPSQIVEVDGKRYLQMENGTVTIQCTTGRAVKDVKFIGLPEDYTWDYVTSDLGTIDSLHWTMTEGFDKVIFTFTKPELIAGISVGGYLPGQAKTYYKADYEEGATTAGWSTSVGGRYDPEVIEEDGNHFLSIKQDSRYNNGASFKGTVLKGALPEDVTDFTLEFDMRLGGTNNQIPNLQFQDAEGKSMLTLTLQAANGSVWTINNKAEMTLDLKNSAYKSGGSGRLINEIDWYSYKLSHKDGLNYLTVVHKATGDVIYNQEPLESDAVNGGVGDIVFATARYFANIAFDNIVLREILPDDVPNITISQYTIKWVAEDGVALHEDYTTNAIVGNKVAANAEQVAPIVIDGKKYIYTSGNDSLLVNADAATNILTLNYRVAKTFSWTERGTSPDGILGVIARGEGFEGDAVTVAYPRYMLDKKNRLQYRDPENNQYRTTVTLTKDKQMINISYDLAEDAPQNVIFYSEGENLEGALISNAANTVVRSSNAAAGFYTEDTKILELKPGYYTITAVGFFGSNGGGSVKFTDGTQTLFMVSSTAASNATAATGEFELTENTSLYLASGSNTVCLDYMFIQTEDGGLVTDGIANVKAAYEQGAVYNLKGQKVADSLEGLKAGLYIVNGHKVAVK